MLPDDLWPVSVGDHIIEPPDLWTHRLPSRYRTQGPHVREGKEGGQFWCFGDVLMDVQALTLQDVWAQIRQLNEIAPSNYDPAARVAAMNRDKVAVHTVMPHACGMAGQHLSLLKDTALWAECVRAYNDFELKEFCAYAPDRLVGAVILPLADAELSVLEIERTAKLGARAVSLPCNPIGIGLPNYHHESWTRVLDAADANGLAIFIHIAVDGQTSWERNPAAPGYRSFPSLLAAANLTVMDTACHLVFTELLAQRPDRRIVFLEANVAWFPYLSERLDYVVGRDMRFTERRGFLYENAAPSQGRRPSQIARQFLGGFISDPVAIAARHNIGLDRFVWMSDFPHADSLWPHSRDALAIELANVPDVEARRIAETNARELLRLPIPS